MKTIQMTIDEQLLYSVDQAVGNLGTNRSAFIREALEMALQRVRVTQIEKKHADGYANKPVEPGEFDLWESEQVWGEP